MRVPHRQRLAILLGLRNPRELDLARVHPTSHRRDLVEVHPEELLALVEPIHPPLVKLPVKRALQRRSIIRVDDRMHIELKRDRRIPELRTRSIGSSRRVIPIL